MSDNATSPRVAAAQSAGWKSIVCRPIPAFNQCDDQFDPVGQTGLEIDTLGISGAVLSQIGAAVPGLPIVMDHFAGKPTTFDVEDSWKRS